MDTQVLTKMYIQAGQGKTFRQTRWPANYQSIYNEVVKETKEIAAKGGEIRIAPDLPDMDDGDDLKSLKGGRGSGNFGHQGRPGQVGGSGSGEDWDFETSVPESNAHPIKDFLQKISDMTHRHGPEGYEYKSNYEYVLKNGQAFEFAELPEDIEPMKLGECYKNAFELADSNPELTYVEGMASVHGIPIDHAWVVTKDNKVVDPTWAHDRLKKTEAFYYGVKFDINEVRKTILAREKYGVLHNPEMDFPLLKGKGSGKGNIGSLLEQEDTAFPSLSMPESNNERRRKN